MSSLATIIDRYRGQHARARYSAQVAITVLGTTAYSSGDVMNSAQAPLLISCVAPSGGSLIEVVHVKVWEHAASGTLQHAPLRLFFASESWTLPVQNAAFTAPTGATKILATCDVDGSGWIDYLPATAPPSYAIKQLDISNCSIQLPSGQSTIYVGVVTTGTPTYAADAQLNIEVQFEC